ncbi:MAG: hypothetical protein WC197_07330 [Candidatus Gastranaerophilaceae bacterium]
MSNFKRWYDADPTISLAVSIIRNASENDQEALANFIIETAREHGITVIKETDSFLSFIKNRWYDSNDKLHEALECLKLAPKDLQINMAIDAISYLCTIDNTQDKELV